MVVILHGCSSDLIVNDDNIAEFIKIEPHNISLSPGETKQFFAWGVTKTGVEVILPEIIWNVDSGTIDGNGLYTAPQNGDISLISATSGDIHGKIVVEVEKNLKANKLIIRVDGGETLTVGQKYKMLCFLELSAGGEIQVNPKWESGIGNIDETGLYVAPQRSMDDRVIATYRDYKMVKPFTIKPEGPILIWVKPSIVELKFNEGIQFSTFGIDRFNNIFPMGARFRTDSGTIDSTGFYKPSSTTIKAQVWAEVGNIQGKAEVKITF